MSDFFGKLKSGAGKVAFEADKMARMNKAQGELAQLKKHIEANYMKLGEMYYQKCLNQEGESPVFAEICAAITDLMHQVGVKNEEIQRINAETYGPQGAPVQPVQPAPVPMSAPAAAPVAAAPEAPVVEAAPQTKFCPNCGREMAAAVKFCPDCGTKM